MINGIKRRVNICIDVVNLWVALKGFNDEVTK